MSGGRDNGNKNVMDPILMFKQMLPNAMIRGSMEEIEIVIDANDIANYIANQLRGNGYNCTTEIKGNHIIVKVKLGVRAG